MSLFIKKEEFEKLSEEALNRFDNEISDSPDLNKTEYYFLCENEISDIEVSEDGKITGNVSFGDDSKLGDADFEFKLSQEDIIKIIEGYRKKLGKLKTVLEALKD